MSRLTYYATLGMQDFVRLWSTTQHHVIIVAGIVLPILLLLGLKRGHVAELREELLRSPTGRQVTFWSAQRGEILKADGLDVLRNELCGVEILIPEVDRLCEIRRAVPIGDAESINVTATLYATRPGDPVLQQAGCALSEADGFGLVLSRSLAETIGVVAGDKVVVTISRRGKSGDENASVELAVSRIYDQPAEASLIGFAAFELLDRFEQWIRGHRVAEFNWSASGNSVPAKYSEYLLFLDGVGSLSDEDRRTLSDYGFSIAPAAEPLEKTLGSLIASDKSESLSVTKLTLGGDDTASTLQANITAAELEGLTEADDAIIPWSKPVRTSSSDAVVVGVSLKKKSWLRNFLKDPQSAFELTTEGPVVYSSDHAEGTWQVALGNGRSITIRTPEAGSTESGDVTAPPAEAGAGQNPPSGPHVDPQSPLIVPCQLLARIHACLRGDAEFDPTTTTFVRTAEPSLYGKARLFTHSIDDVPSVVDKLVARHYAVSSEHERITEIHEQDSSLQLLVLVVGLGVFLFGVLTVFSVLLDSTDRKRGVIGILRVMGVSRGGIFLIVLLRAAAIGVLAGVVAAVAGWSIQSLLRACNTSNSSAMSWLPPIHLAIHPADVVVVIAGAILCAAVGAILPAWKASRLDPFDAIVEGRFS